MIITRKAKVEDVKSLTRLSKQLGYTSEIDKINNRLLTIFNLTNHEVFIAENDKKNVGWVHGFMTYRIESEAFVEIGGLVVDENHRRLGIGKLLVNEILNWSEKQGVKKTRVRCNSKRIDSHIFYENIGFNLKKEQKIFDKQLSG